MVILFVEARKLVEKARKWRLNKSSVFDSVFFVPTPLEGGGGGGGGGGGEEELYTQMGFLFSQFWPIDIFIVES